MGRMLILDNVVNKATNQVEGFCAVKSATERLNAKGDPYLDMRVADSGGMLPAKLWSYDKAVHGEYSTDSIIKIRATVVLWNENEQLRVDKIRPYDKETDDIDMGILVPCAPFDSEWMLGELMECAHEFVDKALSGLVLHILEQNKQNLLHWPAALKLHHAQRGGLLYHTQSMLRLAKSVCDIYPALDSDLVYAGVILHDMAKLEELVVGELGMATSYSAEGHLVGHIALGCAMIDNAARETGASDELKMLLQHIILSHHGIPEHGSPKPPMFPEAEVVSQIDLLDARMFEMFDVLDNIEAGKFSERVWSLDNRMLYRHGHNNR